MKLSIAMCTYNGADYLPEQLKSMVGQSCLPDEVVICDDGSSDGTPALLEQFAADVPFPVRIIVNPQNLGVARNFAQAIGLCTGDVIACADQDDLWKAGKLAVLENAFVTHPEADLVFTDAVLVDAGGDPLGYSLWESVGFTDAERDQVLSGEALPLLVRKNVVTGATMAFKADLRERILPIPAVWIHDYWIALLVAAMGGTLLPVVDKTIDYRQHGANQVGQRRKGLVERWQTRDRAYAEREASQFRALREHLAALDPACEAAAIDRIDGRYDFALERVHYPVQRWRRVLPILGGVGRYRTYCKAPFKEILKDMLSSSL